MSQGVSVCGSVSGQAAPLPSPSLLLLLGFKVLHLSLPAPSLQKTEVIDRSHQGDSELDSSSGTAGGGGGGALAAFSSSAVPQKRSTCWNKAGRAPVFSSMSLLFSPKAQSRLRLCHRNILFLCFDPCSH